MTDSYPYDSQGNAYDQNGYLLQSAGSGGNLFRFTGREFDSETGLYYYRARYYDPSPGRFLNEDPIGFRGGSNFYAYVRNNPVLRIDPTGLQIAYLPPDPRDNTIVCDGHGGLSVQIGPKEQKCVIDCVLVHERRHIADTLAANPKVCKGQASGVRLGFDPATRAASEIGASNAERDCLWKKYHSSCNDCKQIILNRIGDVESYRDSFKNKK